MDEIIVRLGELCHVRCQADRVLNQAIRAILKKDNLHHHLHQLELLKRPRPSADSIPNFSFLVSPEEEEKLRTLLLNLGWPRPWPAPPPSPSPGCREFPCSVCWAEVGGDGSH